MQRLTARVAAGASPDVPCSAGPPCPASDAACNGRRLAGRSDAAPCNEARARILSRTADRRDSGPAAGCGKGFPALWVREGILAPAVLLWVREGILAAAVAGGTPTPPSNTGRDAHGTQDRRRGTRPRHPEVCAGTRARMGRPARRRPLHVERDAGYPPRRAGRYKRLAAASSGPALQANGRRGAGRYVARGRSVVRLRPTRSRSRLGSAGEAPAATGKAGALHYFWSGSHRAKLELCTTASDRTAPSGLRCPAKTRRHPRHGCRRCRPPSRRPRRRWESGPASAAPRNRPAPPRARPPA